MKVQLTSSYLLKRLLMFDIHSNYRLILSTQAAISHSVHFDVKRFHSFICLRFHSKRLHRTHRRDQNELQPPFEWPDSCSECWMLRAAMIKQRFSSKLYVFKLIVFVIYICCFSSYIRISILSHYDSVNVSVLLHLCRLIELARPCQCIACTSHVNRSICFILCCCSHFHSIIKLFVELFAGHPTFSSLDLVNEKIVSGNKGAINKWEMKEQIIPIRMAGHSWIYVPIQLVFICSEWNKKPRERQRDGNK